MDLKDIFWLSYNDLSQKKVRTALTILMVVIGIAAIVALTSFTSGISNSITGELESLGPTSIIVGSSTQLGFTQGDVNEMEALPNVTSVTALITGAGTFYAGNQNTSVTVVGISSSGLAQLLGGNVTLIQGSAYTDTIAPEAVIGYDVAFPSSAAGQQTVTTGQSAALKLSGASRNASEITVPVIGILASHGTSLIPIDSAVFVSVQAAGVLLHKTSYNEMVVTADNLSSVNATAALITTIFGSSARVLTTAQLLSTASSIIGSITLLLAVIAGISLFVAAIGIMNIMLMSVMERTHEIGVLKAIGFKNRHVMLVFMLQALIIGFMGGVIGIAAGAGTAYGLVGLSSLASGPSGVQGSSSAGVSSSPTFAASGYRSGSRFESAPGGGGAVFAGGPTSSSASSSGISIKPAFPITTILLALLIAMGVSVVAGLYPAWRASRMEPIDALREL